MRFNFKYRVAWVDTDALGIMHFSNYFRLCERTEQELMNNLKIENDEIFLPRVDARCSFKFPLRFNETASVSMWVKEIGNTHITFSYEIYNENVGRLSAYCEIVVVSVDKAMRKKHINQLTKEKLVSFKDE